MADFGKLRRYLSLPSRTRTRIRREVDDELRAHIDQRVEALQRQGVSRNDARTQALREFGDLDDALRYCTAVDRDAERRRRTTSWLDELAQDASHALRLLRRAPAFTAATLVTLALAIGASTAVYGVLHTYLIRPLPFPNADRLVSLFEPPSPRRGGPQAPSLDQVDWTHVDSLFDATLHWDLDGFAVRTPHYAVNVTGAWISADYFSTLGTQPGLGRLFRTDEYRDDAPVVILGYELWRRHFGADSAVIGSTVSMHSTDRPNAPTLVTVVGVLPRDFWPIHWRESEVLRPFRPAAQSMPALARLRVGAPRIETERRLDAMVRAQLGGGVDPRWHMTLTPALERHSARVRPLLAAVFGAVMFMLLAACGSVAGALVSRTSARRGELAIRLALGGSRARIGRQLLTESALLAALAGVLGLAIAYGLIATTAPLIERLLGTTVPGGADALRPTLSIMLTAVVASTLTGVALGLVPALVFLRLDRVAGGITVFGAGRTNVAHAGAARVRRVLIGAQVCVATMLLFGAGLMFRTISAITATELGFRSDGVIAATMLLPGATYGDSAAKERVVGRLLTRLAETKGVRSVATVFPPPFGSGWRLSVTAADGVVFDERSTPMATVYTVSPGYFETMDVRLRAGRTFQSTDDRAAPLVVVISESLARRISSSGDVVGRRIRVRVPYLASFDDVDQYPWRTIVGVVRETKKEFSDDALADVYVPYAQNPRSLQGIVVRTDGPETAIIEPVRRAVASVDPSLALHRVYSLTEAVAEAGGQRRGLTILLGAFAAFALGLSALALYASLSYTVVQRRSELAVRMAVGASTRSILRLVISEGLTTAIAGVVCGVVGSLALGRVLENQVYGVGTTDPATLASICLVLLVAAVVACVVPSLRASRTDPALALRE